MVLARDLVVSRFLSHVGAHRASPFPLSPALLDATTDAEVARSYFQQYPRLASQAAAFTDARSIVAIPGLSLSFDPRLRWEILQQSEKAPTSGGSGVGMWPVVFDDSPSAAQRRLSLGSLLYRSKGVNRAKLAKLQASLAATSSHVVQSAAAMQPPILASFRQVSPEWMNIAMVASDMAKPLSEVADSRPLRSEPLHPPPAHSPSVDHLVSSARRKPPAPTRSGWGFAARVRK
jgi:hypothetical protein